MSQLADASCNPWFVNFRFCQSSNAMNRQTGIYICVFRNKQIHLGLIVPIFKSLLSILQTQRHLLSLAVSLLQS